MRHAHHPPFCHGHRPHGPYVAWTTRPGLSTIVRRFPGGPAQRVRSRCHRPIPGECSPERWPPRSLPERGAPSAARNRSARPVRDGAPAPSRFHLWTGQTLVPPYRLTTVLLRGAVRFFIKTASSTFPAVPASGAGLSSLIRWPPYTSVASVDLGDVSALQLAAFRCRTLTSDRESRVGVRSPPDRFRRNDKPGPPARTPVFLNTTW